MFPILPKAVGESEDANRSLRLELKTLDGERVRFPKKDADKWTIVSFSSSAEGSDYLSRYAKFADERPIDNLNLLSAVLDDDANASRKVLEAKKSPNPFPTLLVPGGISHPVVQKLGFTAVCKVNLTSPTRQSPLLSSVEDQAG